MARSDSAFFSMDFNRRSYLRWAMDGKAMTYTPEDLRKEARYYKAAGYVVVTNMLQAGADAMEREAQARNQALEEAAQVAESTVVFTSLRNAIDLYGGKAAAAIRALKEKTE